MKSAIQFLLVLYISFVPALGQEDFRVIKVNGTILLKAKGISLETGTVFSEKEDLLFRTEDASAALINSKRGRVIITNSSHDLTTARSNYLPSMYNISSRAVSLFNRDDLTKYFSGRFVVLGKQAVQVNTGTLPMDKDHFFFLRYIYKGEEINKKLPYEGNTFFIDKSGLFMVDGSPIPSADNTRIRLFYHRAGESVLINEFDLIFPEMGQLTRETEIILNEIKEKPASEKLSEVGSFIAEFYGNVPAEQLARWLETSFGIK